MCAAPVTEKLSIFSPDARQGMTDFFLEFQSELCTCQTVR